MEAISHLKSQDAPPWTPGPHCRVQPPRVSLSCDFGQPTGPSCASDPPPIKWILLTGVGRCWPEGCRRNGLGVRGQVSPLQVQGLGSPLTAWSGGLRSCMHSNRPGRESWLLAAHGPAVRGRAGRGGSGCAGWRPRAEAVRASSQRRAVSQGPGMWRARASRGPCELRHLPECARRAPLGCVPHPLAHSLGWLRGRPEAMGPL